MSGVRYFQLSHHHKELEAVQEKFGFSSFFCFSFRLLLVVDILLHFLKLYQNVQFRLVELGNRREWYWCLCGLKEGLLATSQHEVTGSASRDSTCANSGLFTRLVQSHQCYHKDRLVLHSLLQPQLATKIITYNIKILGIKFLTQGLWEFIFKPQQMLNEMFQLHGKEARQEVRSYHDCSRKLGGK